MYFTMHKSHIMHYINVQYLLTYFIVPLVGGITSSRNSNVNFQKCKQLAADFVPCTSYGLLII